MKCYHVLRLARGRDEWESAALQNSNTKCNGLLPIWGPQVMVTVKEIVLNS